MCFMKKYQSSYVLKQIKKKRIFEKKIHMDFPPNLTPVVKDKVYDALDSIISATPRTDKLILLGDFNARYGTGHH